MDISGSFQTFMDWLRNLWNKIDIKSWADSVGGSSSDAVQAAIYFGAGFATGFFLKKYFKFIFFSLLITVFIILFLQYNKVLLIDWQSFNKFFGVDPKADFGMVLDSFFDWAKANLLIVISSLVGFLVGSKLG
ncbi:FUN14 domain-containing protein [Candidatus Babeliales bacterium]|nr:FUN14 domain-containing protein [Candidatus Babeliales bacterium]